MFPGKRVGQRRATEKHAQIKMLIYASMSNRTEHMYFINAKWENCTVAAVKTIQKTELYINDSNNKKHSASFYNPLVEYLPYNQEKHDLSHSGGEL